LHENRFKWVIEFFAAAPGGELKGLEMNKICIVKYRSTIKDLEDTYVYSHKIESKRLFEGNNTVFLIFSPLQIIHLTQ
jgi:hypothetical protein